VIVWSIMNTVPRRPPIGEVVVVIGDCRLEKACFRHNQILLYKEG
jgi:hypothetical protein